MAKSGAAKEKRTRTALETAKRHAEKKAGQDDPRAKEAVGQKDERLCQKALPEPDNSRGDNKKSGMVY